MDPVSQAVVGTMAALGSIRRKKTKTTEKESGPSFKAIALWGALGGLAPDLDVLIRSASDPLFHVQFHRHFTHSIFFIPIGALVVSLFLRLFRVPIKRSYLYTFLGYATHGTLDAFTNYGTQLFWPLSDMRVALNGVAVIDPLCTIPLVILVLVAIRLKDIRFNIAAITYLCLFMSLGLYQKQRVTEFLISKSLINNETTRFMVKPTIFNNVVWRSIVLDQSQAKFYAVKSIPFGEIKLYPKHESAKIVKEDEIENLLKHYDSKKFSYDYERFKHFTSGYLHWGKNNTIVDSRYSILPYSSEAMWSVQFHKGPGHVHFNTERAVDVNARKEFLKLLLDF
ncbi:metal-dependent hydrolase [Halobacteriovorax vibrionivorans]|uniref:Metal-dependent hydrolase n=2 Tax=Halobacteriovorax TaxID=1652133 RepID=A0ABY0ID72_9BACT|nr:metal-dependent hydrolase [Halobacteriovorax vibrionivorans]RZF20909.1 metal-dependent hydrolase [Halobacteriovorax vibrionivorans]